MGRRKFREAPEFCGRKLLQHVAVLFCAILFVCSNLARAQNNDNNYPGPLNAGEQNASLVGYLVLNIF